MQAAFAFGKTGLTVSLPDGPQYCVVEGRSAEALGDAAAAIGAALDRPIGCEPPGCNRRGQADCRNLDLRHHAARAQPG